MVSTLLWADLANPYVWIVLFVTLGFGLIGLLRRLSQGDQATPQRAFPAACGWLIEAAIALVACVAFAWVGHRAAVDDADLSVLQGLVINLGWFFVPFGAVRHRRRRQRGEPHRRARRPRHRAGDDRGGELRLIAYLVGNAVFADYLQIHYVAGTGELAVSAAR